ncbi:MAG: phenylalanine--tRNA ligase subunit beta [Rikenellaceae bacterium]|nr:phenylalanine--tRNA ligase subunit beta [Rikenellaceae bacterium]
MKISYSWLKSYINTDLSVEETARVLTDIGLEVEALERVETVKGGLKGLVVGQVLTCEEHPDSDHLHITTVDYGEGPVQIVCGAPNVRAGLKSIVATVGATLYPSGEEEGFKIKKSKIRGVESLGMLCAEDEIGVGASHDGIIELPDDARVGMSAAEYYGVEEEWLMEIGLTPNRIDAASHYGVARDLSAWLRYQGKGGALELPDVSAFVPGGQRGIEVSVEAPEAAPRYMGVTIRGVKVAPSPEWLQKRLRSIGINPKNNVVDITNFILHELGQPLHAFDAAKIKGGRIVVRTVAEGTPFVTLDGVERKLSAEDLMICNASEPMCIAGVLGGLESGVTDDTTDIFLESAYFNPVSVRKTAKRHGISTDASFRYERGTDPCMPPYALKRAALLITSIAGGTLSAVEEVCSAEAAPFDVELSLGRLYSLIGKNIGKEAVMSILAGLQIEVTDNGDDTLSLKVPPYRVDVRRQCDVAEDILRIYGYNNIEIPQSVRSTLSYAPDPDKEKITETISNFLSRDWTEIMSNSLTSSAYYEGCDIFPSDSAVRIMNPLSGELDVMRQTLLFGALEALELNAKRKRGDVRMYEIGNCYRYDGSKRDKGGLAPYSQERMIGMLVSGATGPVSWNEPAASSDLFTLKSAIESLFTRLSLDFGEARLEAMESDLFSQAVSVTIRGKKIGFMGVVSKKTRSRFDIKSEVYYAELSLDQIIRMTGSYKLTVKELSKYPEVRRDLALLVDKDVDFARLRSIAFGTEKKLLKSVSLFDVYEGDKLPAGKKSYALGFILEDREKTLTDNVIDKTMNNLIYQFERQVGAEIRK